MLNNNKMVTKTQRCCNYASICSVDTQVKTHKPLNLSQPQIW